ncbi:sensor histidine kinase [Paratractidigestivibacter sp.]|uniref:sensor histidine kinase n=1 Tax=Paratractidigestivibacter sp. TaxID=2847316 RepID=UPI002ABE3819|nr:histidine kinase [Paratractidigestivibacter sp.]
MEEAYFQAFKLFANAVNSVLDGVVVLMCIMLNYAIVTRSRKARLDQLMALTCVLLGVSLAGDFLSWTFEEWAGLGILSIIGTQVVYWLGPLAYLCLCLYIFEWSQGYVPGDQRNLTKPRTKAGKVFWVLVVAAAVANLLVVATNPWTGALYSLDTNNIFSYGNYSDLPDYLQITQLFFLLGLLLAEKERLSVLKTCRLWSFAAGIPFFALVAEVAFPRIMGSPDAQIMFSTPGYAMSLFYLYIELQHLEEDLLVAEKLELAESRTQLLSGQIRSHFIFNSLAAIGELCYEDPRIAQKAIADFSTYLRGNMNAVGDTKLISFDAEVSNIKSYVGLEQMNPTTPFEVEWDLQATHFSLPPLVVEPLVENAVVHGVSTRREGGCIWIHSWEEGDAYKVSVRDNGVEGVEVKGSKHNGIAIENGRRRLEMLCGGTLEAGRVEDGYLACVTIPK